MSRLARCEAEIDEEEYRLEIDEEFDELIEESAIWDAFDEYMSHRAMVEVPIESIDVVKSYMRRHWWEYVTYILKNTYWEEKADALALCEDEYYKRGFLWDEILNKDGNKNVKEIYEGIYDYVKNNWFEILFPDE